MKLVKQNLKVLLIVGHGGNDLGASYNGMFEVYANYDIARAMYDFMKPYCNVEIETNLQENAPLQDEVNLVNRTNYDIVISVHNNAGGGDGFECYYYYNDNEMKIMCGAIEKEVIAIGQNSRGVKPDNGFRIIKGVEQSSVILEGFFLDNMNDRELFDTVEKRQVLGKAYGKGVLNYLGINYNSIPDTKQYRVITGSFNNKDNAEKRVSELNQKGYASFIEIK